MKNKYLVYEPFYYIAEEILKYLKPFRKLDKHAVPCDHCQDFSKLKKYEIPKCLTKKEWNIILDKMIFAFQMIVDSENDIKVFKKYTMPKNEEKVREGLQLFSDYFRALWD